ncbi:MAG: alpha/beta hydrolase [Immundisolibacterales bacterium]|nr:alpha/beta hydrolase [Immundisolibacterales bacterium]
MAARSVLTLLLTVLGAFAALCALLYLVQERLIFLPRQLPETTRNALRELPGVVEIEARAADGTLLHGWLRHGAQDEAARAGLVIYFGGNAEEVSGQILDAKALAPWSLAAFNYRGYGLSEGRPGEAALVADALLAYDRLAARGDVDSDRIVVFGRSLGGGVAVQLAAARPVRGVVLVSPFDSLTSVGRRHYPFVPVSLLLRHPFDSLAYAASIEAPLLAIAGDRDRIIPAIHSRRLLDAWGGPKRWVLVPGADHNGIHLHSGYRSALHEFLASLGSPR